MTREPNQEDQSRSTHLTMDEGGSPEAPGGAREEPKTPSSRLHRAPHVVLLTLGYAAIAVFAWVILCVLSYRPIRGQSYAIDWQSYDYRRKPNASDLMMRSDRYLRAARVSQTVTSVLTIPLTSMVCSYAAVTFLQRRRRTRHWQGTTLRQSMALADKGWTDPVIITKLFMGGWKRYGSTFLIAAMTLNLIGASITPLQGLFVSYKSIKVSSWPNHSYDFMDLQWAIDSYNQKRSGDDADKIMLLRSRLTAVDNSDPQFRLWSSEPGCGDQIRSNESSQECTKSGQYSFESMPNLTDPFWAQPVSGFNTGLWRQVVPRVNFSTKYENITIDDFPSNWSKIPDALYLHYENMTDGGGYNVDVCMPANVSTSPWKATRARQDFSEELYVRMTLVWKARADLHQLSFVPGIYSFKVTLNTTAGYFELPNYENGQLPGPLLTNVSDFMLAPSPLGVAQYHSFQLYRPQEAPNSSEAAVANMTLPAMKNKSNCSWGPLLSTALALFGAGSYLDIQHTVTEGYARGSLSAWGGCIDVVPFIKLLRSPDPDNLGNNPSVSPMLDPCVKGDDSVYRQPQIAASYIWLFAPTEGWASYHRHPPLKRIQDAFTAAAFTAVDVWATQKPYSAAYGRLNWDLGVDQQVPDMSRAGMIVVSLLLGLYLSCLLALAVYGAWTPRWTNQLDAFAMMRVSAAAPGLFPLRLVRDPDDVQALDELPGWIGGVDGVPGAGGVGELGLGGEVPLSRKERYHCYASDMEFDALAMQRRRTKYSRVPSGGE